MSIVTEIHPADSARALAHVETSFEFKTDCWDVHHALVGANPGFVLTYCAGPHCNGATRTAVRLARLGRPVNIMAGGVTGWLDEGFALTQPA